MEIKYRVKVLSELGAGDGLRGPHDKNIRTRQIAYFYGSAADAETYLKARTPQEAMEVISGLSWGVYCCEVLEGCEEQYPPALEKHRKTKEKLLTEWEEVLPIREAGEPAKDWVSLGSSLSKRYIRRA